MILFAHHVELEHLPVLGIFLAVGIWLGWHVTSLVYQRWSGGRNQESGVSGQKESFTPHS